jgi:transposase-like protein
MARRHYSDKDRADALVLLKANGGNCAKTGKQLGYPAQTIALWRDDNQRATTPELLAESKKDLLLLLDQGRFAYAKRLLEPQAIATTSGYYAAMTLKALNEAHQLLSGGPTARIEGNLADFLRTHSGTTDKPASLPGLKSVPKAPTLEAVSLSN